MADTNSTKINSISDLYREFWQPISRYLYRLTGSAEIAEELAQESFYQTFISIHKFKGNSTVKTWLYKVARNVYLTYSRRELRRGMLEAKLVMEQAVQSGGGENRPERALENRLTFERVNQVLQNLPEEQRTVLLLKEVELMSHQEIADILGKTVSSTKVLLYRAKQRFHREYTALEGEE